MIGQEPQFTDSHTWDTGKTLNTQACGILNNLPTTPPVIPAMTEHNQDLLFHRRNTSESSPGSEGAMDSSPKLDTEDIATHADKKGASDHSIVPDMACPVESVIAKLANKQSENEHEDKNKDENGPEILDTTETQANTYQLYSKYDKSLKDSAGNYRYETESVDDYRKKEQRGLSDDTQYGMKGSGSAICVEGNSTKDADSVCGRNVQSTEVSCISQRNDELSDTIDTANGMEVVSLVKSDGAIDAVSPDGAMDTVSPDGAMDAVSPDDEKVAMSLDDRVDIDTPNKTSLVGEHTHLTEESMCDISHNDGEDTGTEFSDVSTGSPFSEVNQEQSAHAKIVKRKHRSKTFKSQINEEVLKLNQLVQMTRKRKREGKDDKQRQDIRKRIFNSTNSQQITLFSGEDFAQSQKIQAPSPSFTYPAILSTSSSSKSVCSETASSAVNQGCSPPLSKKKVEKLKLKIIKTGGLVRQVSIVHSDEESTSSTSGDKGVATPDNLPTPVVTAGELQVDNSTTATAIPSVNDGQGASGDFVGKKPRKRKLKDKTKDNDLKKPKKESKNALRKKEQAKLLREAKKAKSEERQRREKVKERQKGIDERFQKVVEASETDIPEDTENELEVVPSMPAMKRYVLDEHPDSKDVLEIDPVLLAKLKPHQIEAVQFMYDCCIVSIEQRVASNGGGCILAHCMGLGKTLSVISFVYTLMSLSNIQLTYISKVLIVCPLNTVKNWVNEFNKWLSDLPDKIDVYELSNIKDNKARGAILKKWYYKTGGVMILGYEMYRSLVLEGRGKVRVQRETYTDMLSSPGPDIVICDEGHILKNSKSQMYKAMSNIQTLRRVILTGTPLQNNLKEYYHMVNYVKPLLLSTPKNFKTRFIDPITQGQCKGSSSWEFEKMKNRVHVLHTILAGCVQRKNYTALTKFLPPKHEYVMSVRMMPRQCDLYQKYLHNNGVNGRKKIHGRHARLFIDYQALMKIWTHPWLLTQENKKKVGKSKVPIELSGRNLTMFEPSLLTETNSNSAMCVPETVPDTGSDENIKTEENPMETCAMIMLNSVDNSNLAIEDIQTALERNPVPDSLKSQEETTNSETACSNSNSPDAYIKEENDTDNSSAQEFTTDMPSEITDSMGGDINEQPLETVQLSIREDSPAKLNITDGNSIDIIDSPGYTPDSCQMSLYDTGTGQSDVQESIDDVSRFSTDDNRQSDVQDSIDEVRTGSTDDNRQSVVQESIDEVSTFSTDDNRQSGVQDSIDEVSTFSTDDNRQSGVQEFVDDVSTGSTDEDNSVQELQHWWKEHVSEADGTDMSISGKIMLLFKILEETRERKDKILVFSQSLPSLNLIEKFLKIQHESRTKLKGNDKKMHSWVKDMDYYRIDGSTSAQKRKDVQKSFNDPQNKRACLFLISTKAGSLGTNLVAANRVIIFDASWNPAHDVQSIFRVYRFGQVKPVYVYRFLAQGTMEEKIYERQVTKQSLSQRVIDEHQIERHFTMADLQALYEFKPDRLDDPDHQDRPLPVLPKDTLLAGLMMNQKDLIVTFHEHDSLLENIEEQELTEEEKQAAWEEYQRKALHIYKPAEPVRSPVTLEINDSNSVGDSGMPLTDTLTTACDTSDSVDLDEWFTNPEHKELLNSLTDLIYEKCPEVLMADDEPNFVEDKVSYGYGSQQYPVPSTSAISLDIQPYVPTNQDIDYEAGTGHSTQIHTDNTYMSPMSNLSNEFVNIPEGQTKVSGERISSGEQTSGIPEASTQPLVMPDMPLNLSRTSDFTPVSVTSLLSCDRDLNTPDLIIVEDPETTTGSERDLSPSNLSDNVGNRNKLPVEHTGKLYKKPKQKMLERLILENRETPSPVTLEDTGILEKKDPVKEQSVPLDLSIREPPKSVDNQKSKIDLSIQETLKNINNQLKLFKKSVLNKQKDVQYSTTTETASSSESDHENSNTDHNQHQNTEEISSSDPDMLESEEIIQSETEILDQEIPTGSERNPEPTHTVVDKVNDTTDIDKVIDTTDVDKEIDNSEQSVNEESISALQLVIPLTVLETEDTRQLSSPQSTVQPFPSIKTDNYEDISDDDSD